MLTIMRIYFIRPQIEISTRLIILSVKIEKNCQILYRKKCMEKWDFENRTSGSIFDFRNGFYGKFWPRKRYNITYLGIVNFLLLCPICRPSLPEPCLTCDLQDMCDCGWITRLLQTTILDTNTSWLACKLAWYAENETQSSFSRCPFRTNVEASFNQENSSCNKSLAGISWEAMGVLIVGIKSLSSFVTM